jgi:hypothetical protein
MNNQQSANSSPSSRKLFSDDISEINAFRDDMQDAIKAICTKQSLIYPHVGRGYKGMLPNFPYALHFMLKGVSAQQAAEMYIMRESGRSVHQVAPTSVEVA